MEKWMKSNRTNNHMFRPIGNLAVRGKVHFQKGRVSHWFADTDRDGVPNVMDCQPRNRRKQDSMTELLGSGGGIASMVARREGSRLRQEQLHAWKEQQRLDQEKWDAALKAQQPIINITVPPEERWFIYPTPPSSGGGTTASGGTTKAPNFQPAQGGPGVYVPPGGLPAPTTTRISIKEPTLGQKIISAAKSVGKAIISISPKLTSPTSARLATRR